MDLVPANADPILQATPGDLEGLFAVGFGDALVLARNYGDWLRVEAAAAGGYRLRYYEESRGKRFGCEQVLTAEEAQAAALDYLLGNWNWHQGRDWCEMGA